MSKSIKHLVTLALFTAMALTIFVIEAQIPVPVPIPGVKLGLANVITLVVLLRYRARDAVAVLLLRILLGSIFTGALVGMIYSLCGGLLCFAGMALLCRFLHRKHIWFISLIGAILHNIGQILAAMADRAGSGVSAVPAGDRLHYRLFYWTGSRPHRAFSAEIHFL